ncbi:Transforming growth factor beta receptor type 3 [Rhynchospora pubera]|uniref:Transforming growth factor beta receptor type 3 n=1 Tax=Rhynchospora pubera TaxID=906938 RepID=A0AAV8ES56_9POAL|nr:Transforming growth factor beta receptor type 3 [Rhynchospora pubera]KAJ4803460.1 Transforming growth factor beta receptor type 3 [Rhynchospora pubera]
MARVLLLVLVLLCGSARMIMARPLGIADPPSVYAGNGLALASQPSVQPEAAKSRPDRSIAGADIILGGFATAVLAVIFCYIRVTRRNGDSNI